MPSRLEWFLSKGNRDLFSFVISLGVTAFGIVKGTREVLKRPSLEVDPLPWAEISFSDLGPWISVEGTVTARGRKCLINSVRIRATHENSAEPTWFDWLLLRNRKMVKWGKTEITMDTVAGFGVDPEQIQRFNILFYQPQRLGRLNLIGQALDAAWTSFERPNKRDFAEIMGMPPGPEKVERSWEASRASYPLFQRTPPFIDAIRQLEKEVFWEPGRYELMLAFRVAGRRKPFLVSGSFTITESDVKKLKFNAVEITERGCFPSASEYWESVGTECSWTRPQNRFRRHIDAFENEQLS